MKKAGIPVGLLAAVIACVLIAGAGASPGPTGPVNLALHRPASSSSIENDEHSAARANDGDPDTYWCADDEPENGAEWWQVDLGVAADLSGCQIRWPFDGMNYRFKVEGSADLKTWSLLSDQTRSTSRARFRDLPFGNAGGIRYVRITVTGFDDGCWASISEVKVFGSVGPGDQKSGKTGMRP